MHLKCMTIIERVLACSTSGGSIIIDRHKKEAGGLLQVHVLMLALWRRRKHSNGGNSDG